MLLLIMGMKFELTDKIIPIRLRQHFEDNQNMKLTIFCVNNTKTVNA